MTEREETLAAALMWLRQHYDHGDRRRAARVLAVVDKLIAEDPPRTSAVVRFWRVYEPPPATRPSGRRAVKQMPAP